MVREFNVVFKDKTITKILSILAPIFMTIILLATMDCQSPTSSQGMENLQAAQSNIVRDLDENAIENYGTNIDSNLPNVAKSSSSEKCSFDVNVYGLSAYNSYDYYADCYIYKVQWSSSKAPSYYSSKYYSGYSQFETATFREIPVSAKQTYLYKITVTYRAKYPSGYEKYFEVSKYANIYPRDAGKWLKGWFYLRSWDIPIPAY
jgi:hypothetical protein